MMRPPSPHHTPLVSSPVNECLAKRRSYTKCRRRHASMFVPLGGNARRGTGEHFAQDSGRERGQGGTSTRAAANRLNFPNAKP